MTRFSPASMNFLAGLFAAAGINMLTSVSTGPVDTSTTKIVLDAALWVVAAGCLTWAAHLVESAERSAERLISPNLDHEENEGIREEYLSRVRRPVRLFMAATGVAVLLAILLLPHLINWSALVD